jgi:adenosylhomocysteine nucleosidase
LKLGIQICSDLEWKSVKEILQVRKAHLYQQPFGEYFTHSSGQDEFVSYHSGPTKTCASAACQFAIDKWNPDAIVNLGTCGGVSTGVKRLSLIRASRTVQYDCIIRFGEKRELFYRPMVTVLDTSWADFRRVTKKLHKGTIATADQDLNDEWRKKLQRRNVLGADWESGAIAKVCQRNRVKCLILRGVSDIPGKSQLPDRDNQASDFERNTPVIMESLLQVLHQISFLS